MKHKLVFLATGFGVFFSALTAPAPIQASLKSLSLWEDCAENLENYLIRENSPLATQAKNFSETAEKNGLECNLLPAISGVESSFGKAVAKDSFNPFGWNNGKYAFKNWGEAIQTVGDSLGEKYSKRWRAKTPEQIGRYYAADPNWPRKVRSFMNKISASSSR